MCRERSPKTSVHGATRGTDSRSLSVILQKRQDQSDGGKQCRHAQQVAKERADRQVGRRGRVNLGRSPGNPFPLDCAVIALVTTVAPKDATGDGRQDKDFLLWQSRLALNPATRRRDGGSLTVVPTRGRDELRKRRCKTSHARRHRRARQTAHVQEVEAFYFLGGKLPCGRTSEKEGHWGKDFFRVFLSFDATE